MSLTEVRIAMALTSEDREAALSNLKALYTQLPWKLEHVTEEIQDGKVLVFFDVCVPYDLEELLSLLEARFGTTLNGLRDMKRKPHDVAVARSFFSFITRHRYNWSWPQIARFLHASSHAVPLVECRHFNTNELKEGFYKRAKLEYVLMDAERRYTRYGRSEKKAVG